MKSLRSNCPINLALESFGDKWSLIIIRDIMLLGKRSFRELLQSEEKIASNILTDRLKSLEKEGIISKSGDPDHKQKHIFSLTEKGIDILPVIAQLGLWSIKYQRVDIKKYKYAQEISKGGPEKLKELRKELVKLHLKEGR